jgi:hypothetical protein
MLMGFLVCVLGGGGLYDTKVGCGSVYLTWLLICSIL